MAPQQATQSGSIRPRLYVAFELSAQTWRLASSDGGSQLREKAIPAGDREVLAKELEAAKRRFGLAAADVEVYSCYEAGRDGFWVHRFLERIGLENIVIDASSMKVDRRGRRAKTDRIDAREILADLIRYSKGDERVWRVVRVPSEEAEDARRLHRELQRLKEERTQQVTRLRSLFATQGIYLTNLQSLLNNVHTVEGPNGPLPEGLRAEIGRHRERLELVRTQIRQLEKQQRESVEAAATPAMKKVAALSMLKGIGIDSAWLLTMEFFGWRDFKNRREVGGAAGLGGTPYNSGSTSREQGISKAGNARVRSRMVELAWLWLRYQPQSKLSCWFVETFSRGGRRRRTGIVALARRLLIELWHLAEHGAVPAGATLKVT